MFNFQTAEVCFSLTEEIGQEGRNSQVFKAWDKHLGAEIVVKRIKKAGVGASSFDPDYYFQESKILYLSGHTNVVPVHYACQDGDHVFIAMPLYARGSLKKRLDAEFLTVREIIRYATQFLSGMSNIHSKGLLHFDIKPDNILLSDRDEALVSDFGLAKPTNPDGSAVPDQFYALHMAPEVLDENQPTTRQTDIYQIGLTLYRMCNGNVHFYEQLRAFKTNDELNNAIINETFPDRQGFLAHIPEKMRKTVKKCLRTSPSDRYASVIEIINDLAEIDDKALDWRYSDDGVHKKWTKQVGENTYCLSIDSQGQSTATKKTPQQEQRIVLYCQASLDNKQIKSFLKAN
jgi:serine/threonine protein kinase